MFTRQQNNDTAIQAALAQANASAGPAVASQPDSATVTPLQTTDNIGAPAVASLADTAPSGFTIALIALGLLLLVKG